MRYSLFFILTILLTACDGTKFNSSSNKNNSGEDETENNSSAQIETYNYVDEGGYGSGYNEDMDEEERWEEAERERAMLSDWHNWEDEDVDGLYVYLEDVDDDDVADYIAREYYDGEYIREGWKYYAKIDQTWGEYDVTLGEKESSHLYRIRGSEIYIHFRWMADVCSGDEGVLDWSGTFSSFYKKPDSIF